MSNEEIKPKPAPEYELITPNSENPRMTVVRKIQAVDFKIDDVLNFIQEAEGDKSKSHAMVEYNDAIIENIKGFHPEVIEYYDALVDEKKTAFLLFAKAVADREKHVFAVKKFHEEITQYNAELKEISEKLGIKTA